MKYILLILSIMISFNATSTENYSNQYRAMKSDTFIQHKVESRIKYLSSELGRLQSLIEYSKATSYDKALYAKYLREYNYLAINKSN